MITESLTTMTPGHAFDDMLLGNIVGLEGINGRWFKIDLRYGTVWCCEPSDRSHWRACMGWDNWTLKHWFVRVSTQHLTTVEMRDVEARGWCAQLQAKLEGIRTENDEMATLIREAIDAEVSEGRAIVDRIAALEKFVADHQTGWEG